VRVQIGGEVEGKVIAEQTFTPALDFSGTDGTWKVCVDELKYTGMIINQTLLKTPSEKLVFSVETKSKLFGETRQMSYELAFPKDKHVRNSHDAVTVLKEQLDSVVFPRVLSNAESTNLTELGSFVLVDDHVELRRNNNKWLHIIKEGDCEIIHSWVIIDDHLPVCEVRHLVTINFKYGSDGHYSYGKVDYRFSKRWHWYWKQMAEGDNTRQPYTKLIAAQHLMAESPSIFNSSQMQGIYIPQIYFEKNGLPNQSPHCSLSDLGRIRYRYYQDETGTNVDSLELVQHSDYPSHWRHVFDDIEFETSMTDLHEKGSTSSGRSISRVNITLTLNLFVSWDDGTRSKYCSYSYDTRAWVWSSMVDDGALASNQTYGFFYLSQKTDSIMKHFPVLYPHQRNITRYVTSTPTASGTPTLSYVEQNTMKLWDMLKLSVDPGNEQIRIDVDKSNIETMTEFTFITQSPEMASFLGLNTKKEEENSFYHDPMDTEATYFSETVKLGQHGYFRGTPRPWIGLSFVSILSNIIETDIVHGKRILRAFLPSSAFARRGGPQVLYKLFPPNHLHWYPLAHTSIDHIKLTLIDELDTRNVVEFQPGSGFVNFSLKFKKF